ncbi:MAG: DNA polymerase I [Christensenellaceae bacterium]
MPETLLAIDGNSLMHRAYWALPDMRDSQKRPVNAVYGFFSMLFKIVEEYAPTRMVVAFDMREKTFRHEVFAEYKAGRRKTPEDLNEQFPLLKRALDIVGVRYVECEGYEADDILGAFSSMAEQDGVRTYIFTGDKDELQLIDSMVSVVLTKKGVSDIRQMTVDELQKEWGITPAQVTDLKGLMGDSSDNIPGVAGVGEKTALKLLHEYGTVESLYEHIEELPKNKLYEKLVAGKESAFLSKQLATINRDVPMEETLDSLGFAGFSKSEIEELCSEFGFRSFMKRFEIERTEEEPAMHLTQRVELQLQDLSILDGKTEAAFLMDGGFCFSFDGQTEYCIKRKETLLDDGYDQREILEAVAPYFKDRKMIGFDIKKAMHEYENEDILFEDYYDVMIAAWVLNPSYNKYDITSVLERGEVAQDAAGLYALYKKQQAEVLEMKLEKILYEIELPLLRILYAMEKNGFYVSRDELSALGTQYDEKIGQLTKSIYELAGAEFNISSTKQLAEILFEKLGLPPVKKTKTGYSTDAEVLEKLEGKHEIIEYIIEYRALTKLKSTYIDGLLSVVRDDGYIHTTFLQTATATGRLSSVEPNLQNIPIKSAMANDIRHAFVAPEGYRIVSADYSQIELRILADIADDKNMKRAFGDNEDIHARTAAEVLGKEIEDVTPAERASAKATNFGIVYGISDFGLARNSGMSRKRSAQYIERYLEEFSGVKRYMDSIKKQARQDGYVRTLFGRIRYIPELKSGNYNIRSAGERAALNTPIQGSAADIIKLAMIEVDRRMKEQQLESILVLQVHDELIVYAKTGEEDTVRKLLKDCMQNTVKLGVALDVNVAVGNTWAEAK